MEWTARRSKDGMQVVIDSADFENDALLILTGDFETEAQKLWYAGALADKLNRPTASPSEAQKAVAWQYSAAWGDGRLHWIECSKTDADCLARTVGYVVRPLYTDLTASTSQAQMLTGDRVEEIALEYESGGAGVAEGGGLSAHFFCATDIGLFATAIQRAFAQKNGIALADGETSHG